MPRAAARASKKRQSGGKRRRFARLRKLLPGARLRKRWYRALRRAPPAVQTVIAATLIIALGLTVNWIYQVVRKPSELLFPISGTLYRTPSETWRTYASVFRRHSTQAISAEFLAALAQVEGSGNPVVRTYWRWSLTHKPFEVYRPASSAVGMFQITDGTFAEARRYCIHDHRVVEDGPWNDIHSCWFNGLYTRVLATNAIELTSAYLDLHVAQALAHRSEPVSLQQKQDLAAVIHLCGAGAGERYARRGLRLIAGQRCGDHDVRAYVARVNAMKRVFEKMGTDLFSSRR
jgi:hypothetical protein